MFTVALSAGDIKSAEYAELPQPKTNKSKLSLIKELIV
jgi:hypothetical protein